MTRTVDVVIVTRVGRPGAGRGGASSSVTISPVGAAAIEAVRRGHRVLVVTDSSDERWRRRLRRDLRAALPAGSGSPVAIVMNAEVACVDGVGGVEAVVLRSRASGRLRAVNTAAVLVC